MKMVLLVALALLSSTCGWVLLGSPQPNVSNIAAVGMFAAQGVLIWEALR